MANLAAPPFETQFFNPRGAMSEEWQRYLLQIHTQLPTSGTLLTTTAVLGTANQIIATAAASTVTLSLAADVVLTSAILGTANQIVATAAASTVTLSLGSDVPLLDANNAFTGVNTVTLASAASVGWLVQKPTGTVGSAPTIRALGFSPSIEVLNKDGSQNWYFGIQDAVGGDNKFLYLGRGYGPNQGITPTIKADLSDNVTLAAQLIMNPSYTPTAGGVGNIQLLTAGSTAAAATLNGLRNTVVGLFATDTDEPNEALMEMEIQLLTNPGAVQIAKTGLLVNQYVLPDNGGDTSCVLLTSTGAGNGLTAYKLNALRPAGQTDYSNLAAGYAIEAGTDGGNYAVIVITSVGAPAVNKIGGCIQMNLNTGGKGILAVAGNGALDGRIAYACGAPALNAADTGITYSVTLSGIVTASSFVNNTAVFLMRSTANFPNNAAAQAGTLTNAPSAGNPTKWIPIDDNGVTRNIPCW